MENYPYSCLEQRVSKAIVLENKKEIKSIIQNFPSFIDPKEISKIEDMVNVWCSHAQGYSIRSATRTDLDNRYAEVITIADIIKTILIPANKNHVNKDWYKKFVDNGYTF